MNSLRLIRALDAMLLGMAGLMILLPQVMVREMLTSGRGMVCLIPIFFLAYVSFKVPRRYREVPDWERLVQGMRTFGILWAGTSPFVIWWLGAGSGLYTAGAYDADMTRLLRYYFLANAAVAVLSGTIWMMHANWLVQRLARLYQAPALELEASLNRWLLLIGSLCLPMVGIMGLVLIKDPPFEVFMLFMSNYGRWVGFMVLLPLLPILMVTTLIFRLRFALLEQIQIKFERLDLDEEAQAARAAELRANREADHAAAARSSLSEPAAPVIPPPPAATESSPAHSGSSSSTDLPSRDGNSADA